MSFPYIIDNTAGQTVATITPATNTGATFPITMYGYGWSPWSPVLLQNDYQLMENFASATPPTNPVPGMWNFSTTTKEMYFNDSVTWQQVVTASNSISAGFNMDVAAINIDFTQTGSTVIFTYPNDGKKYHPVSIMLIPTTTPTNTLPPTFNLNVHDLDDVMENVSIINPNVNSHTIFPIEGTTRFLYTAGDQLKLNITTPANNTLNMQVLIFGLIN